MDPYSGTSVLEPSRRSITDPNSPPRIDSRTVGVAIPIFRPCSRGPNCAVGFPTGGSLYKGNEHVGTNQAQGITSRRLTHAAGRSPHSRGARRSAERSEHSPTAPPQAPFWPALPAAPCRQSHTTTEATRSTKFGCGRLAQWRKNSRFSPQAEEPSEIQPLRSMRSHRGCQIPRRAVPFVNVTQVSLTSPHCSLLRLFPH